MKEIINLAYGRFEDFVRRVPHIFPEGGKTIYKTRNRIKVFKADGMGLNVKRYRVPLLINRVIYRFFRQPKAVRAYEYVLRPVAKGFEIPTPVTYALFRERGLLGYSYFISLQSSCKTLYKAGQRPVEENGDIFRALGTYMAKSHKVEVYHAGSPPGNVLYDRTEEGVRFSLIDINRMYSEPVSLERGCENFSRSRGRGATLHLMAEIYVESRYFDKAECLRWILHYRNHLWKKYALKHGIELEL